MSSRSATLHTRPMASPPRFVISSTAGAAFSSERAAMTMRAPSLASALAMPAPTPLPAPVTIATLPSSFPLISAASSNGLPEVRDDVFGEAVGAVDPQLQVVGEAAVEDPRHRQQVGHA